MIPAFLLKWVAGRVGEKFAAPLIYIAGGALLFAVLGLGKCAYDASIIDKHDSKQALKQSEADRKADAHAADRRRADDTRLNNEADELERTTHEATDAAARRLARQRCIRLQQAARRDGRQPPTCG